jgi:hypothetical protein
MNFCAYCFYAAMFLGEVLDQCSANIDGGDLVPANATRQDFLFPGGYVEVPLADSVLRHSGTGNAWLKQIHNWTHRVYDCRYDKNATPEQRGGIEQLGHYFLLLERVSDRVLRLKIAERMAKMSAVEKKRKKFFRSERPPTNVRLTIAL